MKYKFRFDWFGDFVFMCNFFKSAVLLGTLGEGCHIHSLLTWGLSIGGMAWFWCCFACFFNALLFFFSLLDKHCVFVQDHELFYFGGVVWFLWDRLSCRLGLALNCLEWPELLILLPPSSKVWDYEHVPLLLLTRVLLGFVFTGRVLGEGLSR